MIEKLLNKHPLFNYTSEIADICKPLNLLNINYFAHANIDSKKQFSVISSGPHFVEHYLRNHYFNADIHMTEKTLGSYVMWDFVKLGGKSHKMHTEAGQFGIKHTFTIIEKNDDETYDYYHFASKVPDNSINQMYLANLDLLKVFILHFKENIAKAKHLSAAYNFKILPYDNLSSYTTEEKLISPEIKADFIKQLCWNKTNATHFFLLDAQLSQVLTLREQECLYFYIHGKSPKEISSILFVSKRTVEQYMENIKIKLNVQNKSQLIEKVIKKLYINSLR